MTHIKKWLRWCQNHVMTLMAMIKWMRLCCAMDRVTVFTIGSWQVFSETRAKFWWNCLVQSPWRYMVLIGFYQQPGNCNTEVLGKAYSDRDLWLKNNNSYFPSKNKSARYFVRRFNTNTWLAITYHREKNTVQTLMLFFFLLWPEN